MIRELTAADIRLTLCLNDIDGFESVIARMPTADECADNGLPADRPVVIVQRKGGKRLLYRADMVTLTIDAAAPPARSAIDEAARYLADQILENLDNARADLAAFSAAADAHPKAIVTLAGEFRQRRADELLDAELAKAARADTRADVL